MRARPAHDTRPARHSAGGLRAVSAAMAMLALMMQLLVPSLVQAAAANGSVWIEICAEAGAVWIEVDEEDAPPQPGNTKKHSECRDCFLCAVATAATPVGVATLSGPVPVFCVLVTGAGARIFTSNPYDRPMTRGPPAVALIQADRARSVLMAPTFVKGDAL